jgi:hypothetical protein
VHGGRFRDRRADAGNGVPSIAVDGWEDTADKLDELLTAL